MFKYVAGALTAIFGQLEEHRPWSDDQYKYFTYGIRVMELVLTCPSSNIGALEVYGDPTLQDLFTAFWRAARVVDLQTLAQRPKPAAHLMQLINCVVREFIDQIVAIDSSFLHFALIFTVSWCRQGRDKAYNPGVDSFRIVLEIIRKITYFCLENAETEHGRILCESTRMVYDDILVMLEETVLTGVSGAKWNYDITDVMVCISKMKPSYWPQVKHKLGILLGMVCDKNHRDNINRLLELDNLEDLE
jgi:hypothetical protein